MTAAGSSLFTEQRQIAVTAWPSVSAWRLSFQTMMRNVSEWPISIGSPTTEGRDNAGYGGLFWRGPASYTGGAVLTPSGAGGDGFMGRRGPWLAFAGHSATVIFRDAPANPGYPCQWFVRSTPFACVCPAPFFAVACEVPAGDSLTLRYDVIVADGELDPASCGRLAGRKGFFDRTYGG
jgi:hypothetical protein